MYTLMYKRAGMPETISDTRANLTKHVQRFRDEGLDAEPVVFGDNRRPDAALLPYETFELLMEVAEDVAIAQRIRDRLAEDTGSRTTLGELAHELGVDLDGL
jgi:antitoxin StbD